MITPRFSLSQDENTLSIIIRAPYCSLGELDVSVEEAVFIFSCSPYYLRLHLPGSIEENESTKSSFNSDTGEFSFQYEKINLGEHFPDLEFITKFLCSKIEITEGNRKIEIVGEENASPSDIINNGEYYGFAMRGGYDFKMMSKEFKDVFEIDPHDVQFEERQKLRLQKELMQFNADHYLADLFDNDEIHELLQLHTPWEKFTKGDTQFTTSELDFLKDLPNISYNLDETQIKYCHNSLIEILYAYCYDYRTTYFETTCESGWTISKLSASLCYFDSFLNPREAIICAFRRSLIYPLYRDFNLCQQILKDVKTLVKLGEQFIIKCLINIYNTFLTGDSGRYILNNLFIKDYIIYVMKWDKELWCNTVNELNKVEIEKNELGLNLLELEKSADLENNINVSLGQLNINERESDTDSDDLVSNSSDSENSDDSDECASSSDESQTH